LNKSLIWKRNKYGVQREIWGTYYGTLHDDTSNKTIKVKSNPFVYIDFKKILTILQQLVTIVTDKKYIYGEEISAFGTIRWHFLTKQEWYARLVEPYYRNCAEFGIQTRWLWLDSVRFMFRKLKGIQSWLVASLIAQVGMFDR